MVFKKIDHVQLAIPIEQEDLAALSASDRSRCNASFHWGAMEQYRDWWLCLFDSRPATSSFLKCCEVADWETPI